MLGINDSFIRHRGPHSMTSRILGSLGSDDAARSLLGRVKLGRDSMAPWRQFLPLLTLAIGAGSLFATGRSDPAPAAVVAVVLISAFTVASIRRLLGPDERALERDAIARMRDQFELFVEAACIQVPGLEPPVAVSSVPEQARRAMDLSEALDAAETVADRLFLARYVANPARCTLLLGEPGAGKTVMLSRIAARITNDRIAGRTSFMPLVLQLSDWSAESTMSQWVTEQALSRYAIEPAVTRRWVRHDAAMLFLDGFDEVLSDDRDRFVTELDKWLNKSLRTRVVVSCRTSEPGLPQVISRLPVDQLAVLRPFSPTQTTSYRRVVVDGFNRRSRGTLARGDLLSRLDNVIGEVLVEGGDHSKMALRMLTFAASRLEPHGSSEIQADDTSTGAPNDPADPILALGDEFFAAGDYHGARGAYLAASRITASRKRPLATMLFGICEAVVGNADQARRAMDESVAARLAESIAPYRDIYARVPNEDAQQVLVAMRRGVSYDISQICSRSGLSPSRADAALHSLREIGAVETPIRQRDAIRFRRSEIYAGDRE